MFLGDTCYIAGEYRYVNISITSQNLPGMFVLAGVLLQSPHIKHWIVYIVFQEDPLRVDHLDE